jgi:hypothetical protein
MAFADILAAITEEADRTQLEAVAKKHPNLQDYLEAGEQLDRIRPRLRALGGDESADYYASNLEGPVTELENWRKFKATDWPVHAAEQERLRDALSEAQTRVAELEATRGTDMEADEVKQVIAATLKELGVATTADVHTAIEKTVNEKINPAVDRTVNGLASRFEDVFDKIEDVLTTHRSVFPDDKIRAKQVFDYMKTNKETDPEKAYKAMTADKYTAKQKKEQDEALQKAREEGKAEGLVEGRRQGLGSGRSQPVDGSGNQAPRGALMARWAEKKKALDDAKIPRKLGDGRSAAAGAAEYREKIAQGEAA